MPMNEACVPSFRVEFGWDSNYPTRLRVGVFNRALPQPVYTTIPIETPRRECYEVARRFGVWVNGVLKPGWECDFNRQRLYNDYVYCTRLHMGFLNLGARYIENVVEAAKRRDEALERAKQLCYNLHPDIAAKVESGSSFYIQSTRYVYICNVESRRLWVLLPEGPKSLCVYLKDPDVQQNEYDWAIAMYRYLMGAEQSLLKTANHFDFYLSSNEEVRIATQEESESNTDASN